MFYVYLLQAILDPTKRYVGYTTNIEERLATHNSGSSPHTSKYKPWKIVATFGFEDKNQAINFEKYLKSGSGSSFAQRHFWAKP